MATDEQIQLALLGYCRQHVPRYTCDERGCLICNAGPEGAAESWFQMWADLRTGVEYGPIHLDLPFDPNDEEEVAELISIADLLDENGESDEFFGPERLRA